jgi:hypothetical protein
MRFPLCWAALVPRWLPLAVPLAVALLPAPSVAAEPPVALVELFTSEGCSSCPPADELLARLAAQGQVDGVQVIGLEWHVDYWNYLGWRDPFSSAAATERQRDYASLLAAGRTYTPQLVVDGQRQAVGSNQGQVLALIRESALGPKRPISLALQGDRLTISVAAPPAGKPSPATDSPPSELWLALTESELRTAVARGENSGQTLRHGPIVRQLRRLTPPKSAAYELTAELTVAAGWQRAALRAVVFLKRPGDGAVVGAAQLSLSH